MKHNKLFYIIVTTILLLSIAIFAPIIYSAKKAQNIVRLAFITDDHYTTYMRTAIRSVIANKSAKTKIEIYVIGLNLSDESRQKISKESKNNVQINILKITDKDIKNLPSGAKRNPFVSKADNAKFFIASILSNLDKVLYLDGDVIVLKDLYNLYSTDLGTNYVAAVDDWQTRWRGDLDIRYFNNGIMLLNLKQMRKDNIEQKLLEYKKNDPIKRFVTQDSFNYVMRNKVVFLPLIYDTFAPEYDDDFIIFRIEDVLRDNYNKDLYPYKNSKEFLKDVAIIHYCGFSNFKPWLKLDFWRRSNRIWYRYAPIDFWISCIKGECKLKQKKD